MLKTTSDMVPGREISETIGLVTANAVRARHVGRDVLAGLKNLIGGEIGAYRQLLTESRQEALERLDEVAEEMGADAVVALRLTTSSVAQSSSEILAYGTAVKLR
ncbi:MAG TPA: heavy metal-binding domain-containing protein [Dehalococcoidia bacterium]|nr:heavy metal-binding domain-containing protein [Dehalococcoidia bacterium]